MSDDLFGRFAGRSKRVLCQNDGGGHEVRVVREEARKHHVLATKFIQELLRDATPV